MSYNVTTIFCYKTDLNADSVEWCPHEPHQNVFVCANYELIEQNDLPSLRRVGKLLLFTFSIKEIKLIQTVDTNGILDQKWCHKKINDLSLLGIATSTGQLIIYKLNLEPLSLELICLCEVTSIDTLLLSLDWSTGIYESGEPTIVCSDSKGSVHLLKLYEQKLEKLGSWKGPPIGWGPLEIEVWVAGFYYWDTNIFFSGADDGMFLMYDKRIEDKCISKNNSHEAGVTSLHSNMLQEYVLVTGSYDEHIRLWDIRNIKHETTKLKMPGEVWRVKWEPHQANLLLAACMYKGVHVVDFSSIPKRKIMGSYYEHTNICYGIDWSYLGNENFSERNRQNDYIIGSCSFYDKLLCISKFKYKN